MSATSAKIYGNDIALDVKADFCTLYSVGKTVDEINEYILAYQPDDNDEEACAFWAALALVEWEYGVLLDDIKEKAKYIIKNKSDISLFDEKNATIRENELEKLYQKLDTENITLKKRKKIFVYRTIWHEGDILALPLYEKYVYIHVCAINRTKRKIKELEQDQVFVRIFDKVSDELLDINYFESSIFKRLKYKNLDIYSDCFTKRLWCAGIREKRTLESKLIYVGNLPTSREQTNRVYSDFQFKKIENTLLQLFDMNNG